MLQIIDQKPDSSQILLPFPPSSPGKELKSYSSDGPRRLPAPSGPPKEPLGSSTVFNPAFAPRIDTETRYKAFRRVRFQLLRVAAQVSPKGHRLRSCTRHPGKDKNGDQEAKVYIEIGEDKARWRKVLSCQLPWCCPVCAPRIMVKKQREIEIGQELHWKKDGRTIMVTYTNRHHIRLPLKGNFDRWSKAQSRMKSSRRYTNIKEKYGLIGTVRTTEAPHGVNGWHVHAHEAWFITKDLTPEQCKDLEAELFELWYDYCKKYNLGLPSRARGVRVDHREPDENDGDFIGRYLTKIGAEMTGGVHKKSKMGGRTYFEILHSLKEKWNAKDHALAQEYIIGTKGKSMVRWSKGLREYLGLDEELEKRDREAEAEKEKILDTVGVTADQFYAIATANLQARVLEVAEDYGKETVKEYIALIHAQDTGAQARIQAGRAKRKLMETAPTHIHMHSMGMRILV